MAKREILDVAVLLTPIPGDQPAGSDLRADPSPSSVYQEIRAAGTKALDSEKKGQEADWGVVWDLVPKVLAERSKDVELAFWFLLAAVRKHGFAGCKGGLRLVRALVTEYWDKGLHPRPAAQEGTAARVRMLEALNGRDGREGPLVRAINKVHLTESSAGGSYGREDFLRAQVIEDIADPEKKAARIEQAGVSLTMFEKAASGSSENFCRNLNEDLQQCIEELDQLAEVLAEKCGKDENGNSLAPPASGIQEALLECQKIVREFAKDKLPPPPEGAGGPAKEDGGMTPEESSVGRGSIPPTDKEKLIHQVKMTRKDALRQLRELAEFFKATEPHSPISYALERIAAWGELPLPALWSEIIAEDGARSSAFKLVGIPPAQGAQEPGK